MNAMYSAPGQVPASVILSAPPEDRLTVCAAAILLNKHPSSVWRWIERGVVGRDGVRRYLPAARVGGRSILSKQHCLKFVDLIARHDATKGRRRLSKSARERLADLCGPRGRT